MPFRDPGDGFFYPIPTLIMDSYNQNRSLYVISYPCFVLNIGSDKKQLRLKNHEYFIFNGLNIQNYSFLPDKESSYKTYQNNFPFSEVHESMNILGSA